MRSLGSGRAAAVRLFVLLLLGISVITTVCGVLFAEIHGGTSVTRAVAYAFWFAAAFVLLAMAFAGNRALRRRGVPHVDGWVFVAAAFVLTGIGAVVDALGSPGT